MYSIGIGVPRDYAEAVRWYRLAADQGFSHAQYNLGWMYHNGQGVPQDYAEAVRWLRLAAADKKASFGAKRSWANVQPWQRRAPRLR
nr:tetratricopeptide repeat protein [Yoonia sp.]